MSTPFHRFHVARESEMLEPVDFNRRDRLTHVDRCFPAKIVNIIRLTESEKLFQLRIADREERDRFRFKAGQFVMVEVPAMVRSRSRSRALRQSPTSSSFASAAPAS